MFHDRPYKKDLTALAKGGKVVKHVGKGAREQSTSGGTRSTLTGGDPMMRMTNSYPKPPPADFSTPSPQSAPPVPIGSQPPAAPTAMMPDSGGDEEE
jgi:hypothetical protein